ncbi:ceramidase domain-containing protein [Sphingomonas sp.]|uniref:ceramidase domain-containing protein n=1 Tax=Sphingomonas sp. TaxID=28214 RepID=UPI003D6D8647
MDQAITSRHVLTALALAVLSAFGIMLLLSLLGADWRVYAAATCTATRCFCETPRIGALIEQPANSWSSYGYVFIGFLMIVLARGKGWQSAMPPAAAIIFGITAIFVGLGSVLMHATLTLWGQFFDVLGMYLVGSFMLISALSRWLRIPDRTAIVIYVLLCSALVVMLIAVPEMRRWLFAVLLIVAIIVELAFARPKRPAVQAGFYFGGIVTKAVAFTIWNLDQHGAVCSPQSLWQGHAAWHLLGAAALWLTFCYYRSERRSLVV